MRVHVLCILILVGVNKTRSKSEETGGLEMAWGVASRATQLGLRASEHVVRTEDGYVLRLFRVHGSRRTTGPPVLLMHGLLMSAGCWLDAGNASLASLLAAAGRDVWLGNARGSHYSRSHAWLNPDTDALYWQFSADEMGRYDLPALLDYILTTTGFNKLDYIGFSQGGSTFFIMCSELPHYCQKVNLMIALAPAAWLRGMRSLSRIIFEFFEKTEAELSKLGIFEVLSQRGLLHSLMETLCNLPRICSLIINLYDGPNSGAVTRSTYLAAAAGFPAGTSVRNFVRYSQNIKSKYFQKFDYGPEKNLVLYGNKSAPAYNLSAVTVPTVLIYSKNDYLVDVSNIKWLITKLPNLVEAHQVEDLKWSHMDFTMSAQIPKYVYPVIKKYMDNNNL